MKKNAFYYMALTAALLSSISAFAGEPLNNSTVRTKSVSHNQLSAFQGVKTNALTSAELNQLSGNGKYKILPIFLPVKPIFCRYLPFKPPICK